MAHAQTNGSQRRRMIWTRVDRLVRTLHLYTGLFLSPWMLVYAASALLLNHGPALRQWLDLKPPHLEVIREIDFVPDGSFPKNQAEQAAAILTKLDLEGAHRVLLAQSNQRQLKILRICGGGNYVVTWNRPSRKVVVRQQQPFSYLRFIHFLHFKAGYGQPYLAHVVWAVLVDAVALSLVFWVASGIYIWARRPKKRVMGSLFLVGASVLFIALVVALCH